MQAAAQESAQRPRLGGLGLTQAHKCLRGGMSPHAGAIQKEPTVLAAILKTGGQRLDRGSRHNDQRAMPKLPPHTTPSQHRAVHDTGPEYLRSLSGIADHLDVYPLTQAPGPRQQQNACGDRRCAGTS